MNKICPKFFTQIAPESHRNKYKSKYEEKVLVWIAISPRGISKNQVWPLTDISTVMNV